MNDEGRPRGYARRLCTDHETGPRNDFTGITPAKSGRYGAAKCDVAIRHSRGPHVRACLPNRLPACLPGCLVASLLRLSASSLFVPSSACLLLYHVYRWFYRCYATWHGRGLRGESSMILITDSYIEVSTLISSDDQGEAERSIVTKSCGEISRTKIFDSIQVCNNGGPVVVDRP